MVERIAIGTSGHRNVYLSPKRRSVHMHVMGASGQGKSKFLEHCIQQDIAAGHGVCLIDPEGDLCERIIEYLAKHRFERTRKIHVFDPSEPNWRFRFNPLHLHDGEKSEHRISNVLEALSQVWGGEDSRATPAIRTTLRAILYALLHKGYTLAEAFYLTTAADEYKLVEFLTNGLDSRIMSEIWEGYRTAHTRDHQNEFGGSRDG